MAIHWLTPAALAGLVLLAIPIAIHLVARTPVTRVVVPSLRLVEPRLPRLRRRRHVRDVALLVLRLGALASAAVASAGPLLVTGAQQNAWSSTTIRAIVSDSGSTGAVRAAGEAAVAEEQRTADASALFAADPLDAALPQAVAWLEQQPPGRREIVFVGEGRPDTLDRRVADAIPVDVGVRMRQVSDEAVPVRRRWRGAGGQGQVATADFTLRLVDGRATMAMEAVDAPAIPVILAASPGDLPAVRAIYDAVMADGVRLRPVETWQPLRLEWAAAPAADTDLPPEAVRQDDRLRLLPVAALTTGEAPGSAPAPWLALGGSRRAARRGSTIVIRSDVRPEPAEVERLVRAALVVSAGRPSWSAGYGAWGDPSAQRLASGIGLERVANAEARHGRWAWLVALACLAAESAVRRRRDRAAGQAGDPAAAGGRVVTAVAAIRDRLDREAHVRVMHDTGRHALAGAVAGAALALPCRGAGLPAWLCLAAATVPPALAALRGWSLARRRWTPAAVADRIEREHPVDNLLVTAEALGRDGDHRFLAPVAAAAWARLETIPAATHHVAGRGLVAAAIVLAGTLGVIAIGRPAPAAGRRPALALAAGGQPVEPAISGVAVDVRAPAYLGGTHRVVRDANRVAVPAGAVVSVVVATDAETIAVAREGAAAAEHPTAGGEARITLDEPPGGIWTLAPRRRGQEGQLRLLVVEVIPDAPPAIRVTEPARDRRLAKPAANLAVRLEATDDHALTSLRLRYTRVSGSGESFTFADHDLPVAATRRTAAEWTAAATLPLASMDLEDGDLVVYRGVASDGRPGAALVESEAFVVEIGALREASSAAGGGEDVDPDQRQAISQQMVIVKTERLHASRARFDDATRLREAQGLAIEQRMVRAEFVFLMGGEVQDEVEEAAQAPDLAEGRQQNQGQSALLDATRAMSRAEARLTAGDTTTALVAEREALRFLQQAFDRRRFLLRPIAERARIDPTRRLQGTLPRSAGPRLAVAEPDTPQGWGAIERAAVAVARARADTSADLIPVAAALTAIDRADAEVARAVAALVAAADRDARRAALAVAQRLVHVAAARVLVHAPAAIPTPSVSGGVADALRRQGSR